MRALTSIDLNEDRQLVTRTEPALSPFFPMQQHLRALTVFNVMKLPGITHGAMWEAVQMGLTPKEGAA